MISLTAPWVFLLLPLPLILHRTLPGLESQRDAVHAPFVGRLAEVLGREPTRGTVVARRRKLQGVAFVAAWLLVLSALARPQWVGEPQTKTVATRDLLLAVDLSGSMDTEDFTDASGVRVDRLTAVKQVLDEFLARREGDRVGLVFFGTSAFVQAPFTDDLPVCRVLLDEAQVGMAGPKTVVGDAIGLAITAFEKSELEERVLIVLTDGNDTGSHVPPDKAAAVARDRGITIHTVAVGDPKTAGEERLDEAALRAIANTTGGIYAHASDRDELEAVYERIDALGARDVETASYRPRRDLYVWPLGTLVVLSLSFFGLLQLSAFARGSGRDG